MSSNNVLKISAKGVGAAQICLLWQRGAMVRHRVRRSDFSVTIAGGAALCSVGPRVRRPGLAPANREPRVGAMSRLCGRPVAECAVYLTKSQEHQIPLVRVQQLLSPQPHSAIWPQKRALDG